MMDKRMNVLEAKAQAELFEGISEICSAVNTVTCPDELLDVSLKRLMNFFGARRGSIYIVAPRKKGLALAAAHGMNLEERKNLIKRLGQGVVGQVAVTKKPMVVSDITRDSRFVNYRARGSYQTNSFICAPLLLKDKLLGVINITDKQGKNNRFSAGELQFLDFVASQIALNYRRVQLYQKFRHIVKRSRSLKNELGRSSKETIHLKRQVVVQEKLATVGKLVGGIAHEFNNPLDGVMRYTNLCLEHVKDEVVRGYLLEIKHGLNRMANIVKNLLACSRTSGAVTRVSPEQAIEQALQALQPEIGNREIQVKKEFGSQIPEMLDYGLERVIVNLLRNAIDASSPGGQIVVKALTRGNNLLISIADNGCGISRENMEKIFEPFFTTKDIDRGCGLGLTIVSEIVKHYNGRINVESNEGEGTRFTITIPFSAEGHEIGKAAGKT